ncbi:MAG TPA: molybdopterin synthase sulfur carrier subunit [Campylobacteraceae bacterium]|jgi:molybdopterin synthase sulfur carrier subunit|nr:molybdopterin synthase sulfur carrier subunit [Campylobacteraceae bacterium]HHD84112.1 molybdopterin synthase sulfur carrier subunit [Campylobacteraceae bacterium]
MATVEFLGPINKESIEIEIAHLSELKEYFKEDEEVCQWLQNSAIAVNDKLISNLNLSISKNDKISLLPPVCGG